MSKKPLRKGKYKVLNWPEYNKALKNRGDLTIWFSEEGIEKCHEEDDKDKKDLLQTVGEVKNRF